MRSIARKYTYTAVTQCRRLIVLDEVAGRGGGAARGGGREYGARVGLWVGGREGGRGRPENGDEVHKMAAKLGPATI